MVAEDVSDLDVFSLRAPLSANADALVRLVDVRGALLHGCRLATESGTFLTVAGARSNRIALRGNDLRTAGQAVSASAEVAPDAVSMDPAR